MRNQCIFTGVSFLATLFLFLYTSYFCTGSCYVAFEKGYLDPALYFTGFVTAISLLFFFCRAQVLFDWIKHIFWWYVVAIFILASTSRAFVGGTLSFDRGEVVIGMMALLFIITLVYVVIAHRKEEKRVS